MTFNQAVDRADYCDLVASYAFGSYVMRLTKKQARGLHRQVDFHEEGADNFEEGVTWKLQADGRLIMCLPS